MLFHDILMTVLIQNWTCGVGTSKSCRHYRLAPGLTFEIKRVVADSSIRHEVVRQHERWAPRNVRTNGPTKRSGIRLSLLARRKPRVLAQIFFYKHLHWPANAILLHTHVCTCISNRDTSSLLRYGNLITTRQWSRY